MQKELDKFLKVDPAHHLHFSDVEPSTEEWKKLRHFYAYGEHKEALEHDIKPSHTRQISIFVRDPS